MQDQPALGNNSAFLLFPNPLDLLTLDCFRGTDSSSAWRLLKASVISAILSSNSVDAWVKIRFANVLSTKIKKDHIISSRILVDLKTCLIFPLIPNSLNYNPHLQTFSCHCPQTFMVTWKLLFLIVFLLFFPLLQKKETAEQCENA